MAMHVPHTMPLLEMDVLRTFIAISETGNFTTAADAVLRTPSAVSMQIKKLEDMLQVSLFRRDARSVTLTHHGEILLGYARRIINLNNETVSRFIQPEIQGVVRLGAPDDIGELMLPGILKHFSDMYPSLAVDVTIDNSFPLTKAVAEGRLDLTLFNYLNDRIPLGTGEKVMTEKLVWVGRKHGNAHLKHPLPISVWDEGCIWRKRALEELTRTNKEFRIAYFCGHYMGQLAAIRADIAIAPLAKFLVQDEMVILGEQDGLPDLGTYDIGLDVRTGAEAPVIAVADYIRAVLSKTSQNGLQIAA
jgi:DNA-binding transcriptional LysR family regulator